MSVEDGAKLYDVCPHVSDSVGGCSCSAAFRRHFNTMNRLLCALMLSLLRHCFLSGAVLRRGVRLLPGSGSHRSGEGLLQRAVAVGAQAGSQQEVQVQGCGGGGTMDREGAVSLSD